MKELTVEAVRENLHTVFEFIAEELNGYVPSPVIQRQIKLSVEEIYMNISRYAYNPSVGSAKISVEVIHDPLPVRVIISFIDEGEKFDPLSNEEPDLDLDIDERPVGGLGLCLVKNAMDGVSYEYKNGQNILTISKELGQ